MAPALHLRADATGPFFDGHWCNPLLELLIPTIFARVEPRRVDQARTGCDSSLDSCHAVQMSMQFGYMCCTSDVSSMALRGCFLAVHGASLSGVFATPADGPPSARSKASA